MLPKVMSTARSVPPPHQLVAGGEVGAELVLEHRVDQLAQGPAAVAEAVVGLAGRGHHRLRVHVDQGHRHGGADGVVAHLELAYLAGPAVELGHHDLGLTVGDRALDRPPVEGGQPGGVEVAECFDLGYETGEQEGLQQAVVALKRLPAGVDGVDLVT